MKISKWVAYHGCSINVSNDLFENYNLVSAGVVNKNNKLVGMITADDVVTVVQEEAEEDTLRLAGVGDEEITDTVTVKTKKRFNRQE